jgi:hypothetical protein
MLKYIVLLITVSTSASATLGWDLSAAASYGACFIDGAPNAYMGPGGEEYKPDAKTSEPLAVCVVASRRCRLVRPPLRPLRRGR